MAVKKEILQSNQLGFTKIELPQQFGLTKKLFMGLALAFAFIISGCDLNPLGGSKSQTGEMFEPGKHTASQPPTISTFADYIIDENDVQTIPFTINDPDTFMVCSFVFVKATSSNNAIIDPTGLIVGGTYPNCTLTISPKAYKFGVAAITVDLYDFWTHATSTFNLNVIHILTPGALLIVDAEGDDRSVVVTWQNAAYMQTTGAFTSPYYTIYFRPVGTPTYTSIARVASPFNVTGLTNGVEYDFYVRAHNSLGNRNSNVVQATPTKFNVVGPEFIAGSTQFGSTAETFLPVSPGDKSNSTLVGYIDTPDANYPLTAPGASLNYAASEFPVNGSIAAGAPKPSSLTSPSGKYKVFMNSQGNILSGAEQ